MNRAENTVSTHPLIINISPGCFLHSVDFAKPKKLKKPRDLTGSSSLGVGANLP